MKNLKKKIIKI